MKKILISLCLLLFMALSMEAQSKQDVVYKNDGSEIRGTIIEQVLGEYLRIRILGGSIFQIRYDEIDKLAQEESQTPVYRGSRATPTFSNEFVPRTKGLYQTVNLGILSGQNRWGSNEGNWVMSYAIGYRLKPYLALGLGLGYLRFTDSETYPVYLDIRGDIRPKKRWTPYYFAGLGYGIDGTEDYSDDWYSIERTGGLHSHFGIGAKLQVAKMGWLFSVGQEFQKANILEMSDNDGNPDTPFDFITDQDITYKRLWFRIGLEF